MHLWEGDEKGVGWCVGGGWGVGGQLFELIYKPRFVFASRLEDFWTLH